MRWRSCPDQPSPHTPRTTMATRHVLATLVARPAPAASTVLRAQYHAAPAVMGTWGKVPRPRHELPKITLQVSVAVGGRAWERGREGERGGVCVWACVCEREREREREERRGEKAGQRRRARGARMPRRAPLLD